MKSVLELNFAVFILKYLNIYIFVFVSVFL